jgi:hypothetical protein
MSGPASDGLVDQVVYTNPGDATEYVLPDATKAVHVFCIGGAISRISIQRSGITADHGPAGYKYYHVEIGGIFKIEGLTLHGQSLYLDNAIGDTTVQIQVFK